jgi:hypothetical protein
MADPAATELDAIYEPAVQARLRRGGARRRSEPVASSPSTGWRRGAVAGTIVTGLVLGLREVFDPPPDDVVLEEIDLDGLALPAQPVTFVLFDGAPRASRIVVRPWLARV